MYIPCRDQAWALLTSHSMQTNISHEHKRCFITYSILVSCSGMVCVVIKYSSSTLCFEKNNIFTLCLQAF